MKKLILLFAVIAVSFNVSYAVNSITPVAEKQTQVDKKEFVKNLNLDGIMNMTPKSYKEATGKKMTFRERIALKIAKKIIKRKQRKAAKKKRKQKKSGQDAAKDGGDDTMGLLSMIFGVLGAVLFFLGGAASLIGLLFGIAGLVMGLVGIKGDNANKTFRVLGIVFGGLVLLFLLLAVILIASFI